MTELEKKPEVPEVQEEMAAMPEGDSSEAAIDDDQKPLYNKRQVSDVVKRERLRAAEKARREVLMEMEQKQQEQMQQQQPSSTPPQTNQLGGMQNMSKDDIIKLISEHAPQALQQQVDQFKNKQFVDSFVSKMQAAESKYPGLEQKLGELDFSTIHPLLKDINDMENAGDIMNELVENPMKMGNLVSLVYSQPKLAQKAIRDLSSSIKANSEAQAREKDESTPYGQIKPSVNAHKDSGDMSVSDFQKASWMRG